MNPHKKNIELTHLFQTRRVLLPPIKWRKNGTEKPMTRK